jgi:transcriptional regulator with XRE-family HTH domain
MSVAYFGERRFDWSRRPMRDFQTLLTAFIARRFGDSGQARLAEALKVNRSTISRIVAGEKVLSLKAIDEWADALGLDGQDRADFRFATEVANSPESISRRLNELEAKLDKMDRDSRATRNKLLRLDAELRALRDRRSGRESPDTGRPAR